MNTLHVTKFVVKQNGQAVLGHNMGTKINEVPEELLRDMVLDLTISEADADKIRNGLSDEERNDICEKLYHLFFQENYKQIQNHVGILLKGLSFSFVAELDNRKINVDYNSYRGMTVKYLTVEYDKEPHQDAKLDEIQKYIDELTSHNDICIWYVIHYSPILGKQLYEECYDRIVSFVGEKYLEKAEEKFGLEPNSLAIEYFDWDFVY